MIELSSSVEQQLASVEAKRQRRATLNGAVATMVRNIAYHSIGGFFSLANQDTAFWA